MQDHECYAQAFYQLMSKDHVVYYQEFEIITRILGNYPQIQSALLFYPDRIYAISDTLFWGSSDLVKRMVGILIEDRMIDQIARIQQSIRSLLIRDGLWTVCIIETSHLISDEYYGSIKDHVKNIYQGHVEFELKINSALKAGLRLFVNDSVIDLSVEGRLKRLVEEVSYG